MPIPYARPVITEDGYGVLCPAEHCGHISYSTMSPDSGSEDDVTKGAMRAHGRHWEKEHE